MPLSAVSLYSMSDFTPYIFVISINNKPMCAIQFQALLVCLNAPNGALSSEGEK